MISLGAERRWVSGIAILAVVSTLAALVAGTYAGIPVIGIYAAYGATVLALALPALFVLAVPLTVLAMVRRVRSPLGICRQHLRDRMGSWDDALGTAAPLLLLTAVMAAFGTLKQLMPMVVDYTWDDTFAEISRIICLGYRPWQITHLLFGSPLATEVISVIYFAWIPLLYCCVFGFALLAPRYLRARFFVSFGAAWILLGVVGAFLFASAGPCYAALLGTNSAPAFAPLMARLQAMDQSGYPVGALHWQAELWKAYSQHRFGPGMGISAMPSMHNSIAFLYVLAAGRSRWWVRTAAGAFAAAILVGSVHLGWHYLADGLFAWGATAAIWFGAGAYLRWCGYVLPESERFLPQVTADGAIPGLIAA